MSLISRIAKRDIPIPSGVTIKIENSKLSVSGKHGVIEMAIHPEIAVMQEENFIKVGAADNTNEPEHVKQMSGTTRSLVANMINGVVNPFEKKLELRGVGYRASVKGKTIVLNLGKSHVDNYSIPEGIKIEVIKNTTIVVTGVDKQRVGQVSAEIRHFRSPERYKGKGIRYHDEVVKLKETKKK